MFECYCSILTVLFIILISVIKAFTAFAAFLCTSASLYSCACHAISFRWHIFAAIKSSISFKLSCWYAFLSVKFSSSDLRPCGWCQLKSGWDRRGLSGVSQSNVWNIRLTLTVGWTQKQAGVDSSWYETLDIRSDELERMAEEGVGGRRLYEY